MQIRYSRADDEKEILKLMDKCFGPRPDAHATANLPGRYLVAVKKGKIVAMTGLNTNTIYENGVELDWTCTDPEHRGCGIMQELMDRIVASTDENIYCSCWRIDGSEKVNLHKHMKLFGFEKIMSDVKHYACGIVCRECPWKHSDCECYEDLYLRKELD